MKRSQMFAAGVSYNLRRTIREFGIGVEIDRFCTAVEMEKPNAVPSSIEFCNSLLDPDLVPEEDDPDDVMAYYYLDIADLPHAYPRDHLRIPAVMHAPFNELHPAAIDPEVLAVAYKRYGQAYETARQMGIRKIVVHSGWLPDVYMKSWHMERAVEFWQTFIEGKGDIEIVIENVLDDEPRMLAELIRKVNRPNIRACLDIGHAECVGEVSLEEWVDVLAPYLGHFHVHENHGADDEHLALGTCGKDLTILFQHIDEVCRRGATLTIESRDSYTSACWLAEHGFIE